MFTTDLSVSMGRLAGVPVRVGPGSVLIAALLATQLVSQWSDDLGGLASWSLAAATAVAFLMSVLAHEVGHVVMARRFSVETTDIRLSFLGGAAVLDRGAPTPKAEMLIAVAGPAVSAAIGAMALGGSLVVGVAAIAEAMAWLGVISLVLSVFNLLPALPLDGGRVLTGFLWWRRKERASAVRTTAKAGRGLAYLFFVLAAYELFVLGSSGAMLPIVIGFFLRTGADLELRRTDQRQSLQGMRIADFANMGAPTIELDANTATARALLPSPSVERFAVVVDMDGVARGVVDMVRVHADAERDGLTQVSELMEPVDEHRASFETEEVVGAFDRGVAVPFVVIDSDWKPLGLVASWLRNPSTTSN